VPVGRSAPPPNPPRTGKPVAEAGTADAATVAANAARARAVGALAPAALAACCARCALVTALNSSTTPLRSLALAKAHLGAIACVHVCILKRGVKHPSDFM
jgi:hypothetical protein